MELKDNLINTISNELQIYKYEYESEDSFINRLLFSAIGLWIIQSTLDKNFIENHNRQGVSKSYITRKVSKIVCEYISLFPSFANYLGELTEAEFVARIRQEYEKAGYMVSTGFDEFVIASSRKIAFIDDKYIIMRNYIDNINTRTIGLGVFKSLVLKNDIKDFYELLYIPKIDAKEWTSNYIKRIRWGNSSKLGDGTWYFDAESTNSFYKSWVEHYPKNCAIVLYKTNDWDYGFARKNDDNIIGVKIPNWLIGQESNESEKLFDNDVRRFMYGMKALKENNGKALLIRKRDHYNLKLFNALPTREKTAMQFLGWRIEKFIDEFNFIIPNETYKIVKELILNLSIEMEER